MELIDLFSKKYIQYPTEQCPYLKFLEIQGAGDEDGALIRPEEGGILLVVLVLWVTSIALFINRLIESFLTEHRKKDNLYSYLYCSKKMSATNLTNHRSGAICKKNRLNIYTFDISH